MSSETFFAGWSALLRTLVVGAAAYAGLVVFLRVSGKRTLSKMNAFDFVVTVALGSTLASILLSKDVALAQGVLALALLIGLQFGVSWLSVRFSAIERLVRSDPTLLAYEGRALGEALRRQRVTRDELESAIRGVGIGSLDDVGAVVLESNGEMTVVARTALVRDGRSTVPAPGSQRPRGDTSPDCAGPRVTSRELHRERGS